MGSSPVLPPLGGTHLAVVLTGVTRVSVYVNLFVRVSFHSGVYVGVCVCLVRISCVSIRFSVYFILSWLQFFILIVPLLFR